MKLRRPAAREGTPPEKRSPQGRPRCETTRAAILDAARNLFATHSLRALSIEAIAREAGVSKATIYRWWNSKGTLILDACLDELQRHTRYADDQTLPDMIANQMRRLVEVYSGSVGRMVAQLLAEGQHDRQLLNRFYQEHIQSRRQDLAERIGGDPEQWEILMDMIYGPVYFRLLFQQQPLDESFAERLATEAAQRLETWVTQQALGPVTPRP
ncbi:TetR/AcrR family transcriptional regulator [Telmatospirillum siberiense]|nr:TetR/AcrR family transcriptional regulator [Telmatospirillum siberiense]